MKTLAIFLAASLVSSIVFAQEDEVVVESHRLATKVEACSKFNNLKVRLHAIAAKKNELLMTEGTGAPGPRSLQGYIEDGTEAARYAFDHLIETQKEIEASLGKDDKELRSLAYDINFELLMAASKFAGVLAGYEEMAKIKNITLKQKRYVDTVMAYLGVETETETNMNKFHQNNCVADEITAANLSANLQPNISPSK